MSNFSLYNQTPFDLTGRSALVSGGAGLLGTEFCLALASAGAQVVVADIEISKATDTVSSIKEKFPESRVMAVALDVTDSPSIDYCIEKTVSRYNGIDILVNSAAIDPKFDSAADISPYVGFTEFPQGLWEESIAVNLTGGFLLTQKVCKVMEKAGKGSIIMLGSNYGLVGPDQRIYMKSGEERQVFKPVVYSVSKAGLIGLTKYLAVYYSDTGIRVNILTPSGVYNDHGKEFEQAYSSRTVLRRMSRPEEFQGALLFLASDASSYMTGGNLVIDGGWTAL